MSSSENLRAIQKPQNLRLGLCVCSTKNPKQRWVQQLVLNNNADEKFYFSNANNLFPSISTIYFKLIVKKYSNTFNLCTQG